MAKHRDLPEDSIYQQYFEYSRQQLEVENEKLLSEKFYIMERLKQLENLQAQSILISQKLRIIDELRTGKPNK